MNSVLNQASLVPIGGFWWQQLPSILSVACITLIVAILLESVIFEIRRWIADSRSSNETWSVSKSLRGAFSRFVSRWTNRGRGYVSAYWVSAVCVFALLGFASVPLKHMIEPAPVMTAHWWYFPHVPEDMPANKYVVLHLDKLDPLYGTRSRYTFCGSSVSMDINEGEMVKDVVFKDHGDCIQLLNYNYERESYPPYRAKKYSKEAFQ